MNRTLSLGLKGLVCGLLLSASTLIFALPTPKDIEASVQSGQLSRAESQLREVLKEKPKSAKAHYELGEVLAREGRYFEAEEALRQAQRLEPSLSFASSPQQFTSQLDKLARLNAPKSAPPATGAATPAAQVPMPARAAHEAAAGPSMPWGLILLGLGVLALVMVWVRRSAASASPAAMAGVPAAAEPSRGFGQAYAPAPAYPGYAGAPAGNTGMGSGVAGAVLGGAAGLAAGYALSKALEGGHGQSAANHGAPAAGGNDFQSFDAPTAAPDFGAFDAGAGDGWDNADAGSSDDNW